MELVGGWLDVWSGLVFCVVFLTLLWTSQLMRTPAGIPPHRWRLPILGNLLQLDRHRPHETFRRAESAVISVWMGSTLTVVLNSYQAIREALVTQSDVFTIRPDMYLLHAASNNRGIICSDGDKWKEQRRFTLSSLRDFGFGRQSIQAVIHAECTELLQELRKISGGHVDIREYLNFSILNVICHLLLGERFSTNNNPDICKMIEQIHINEQLVGSRPELNFMPWLRFVPGFRGDVVKIKEYVQQHHVIFQRFIDQHRNTLDRNHPRDYLDTYLIRMSQVEERRERSCMNDKELIHCIGDMFAAGSDTTSSTLQWAILYLVHNPDVQTKVQEEIDVKIGRHRLPDLNDKLELPYTEAVIMEVQRMACIVPLGVPHGTSATTQVLGYTIPEGTCIFPNLWAVFRDERLWADPDTFKPERFLDDQGKVQRPEYFIPFSIGPRTCLGESLAKQELFLFFSSLLQHFTFTPEIADQLPSTEAVMGMILSPKPFKVKVTQR